MSLELRVVPSIRDVDPLAWDACAGRHPFVRHAFLSALEASGAVCAARGVLPGYALLSDGPRGLVACAPVMQKSGTRREFGPEVRWLSAGSAAGCFAWPKFQVGLPFFPVMGPKLLARGGPAADAQRAALLVGLREWRRKSGDDVFNIMHIDARQARQCRAAGALLSCEWHSHWANAGHRTYADYLLALPARKRRQARIDRHQAESHQLEFRVLRGRDIRDEVLADYYDGHRRVCARHGGRPWLPEEAYRAVVAAMPEAAILMAYADAGKFVAGILGLEQGGELYLLQWSERATLAGLAMDLVCFRPIEYAIHNGLRRVDSGLDAGHKRFRDWQPVPVYQAHWFFNDELRRLAEREVEAIQVPQPIAID
jgi:predicted N-acyltransferase